MISAEARGKRRVLMRWLERSAQRIEDAIEDPETHRLVDRTFLAGNKGRLRARQRLIAKLPGVRWTGDGLLGMFLSPKEPVILNPTDVGQTQRAITTRFVYMAPEHGETGLWTLEVPEHAVGRIIERSAHAVEDVIASAHVSALLANFDGNLLGRELLLPAADGYLVVEFVLGRDRGNCFAYLRSRTFLNADLVRDDQHHTVLTPGDQPMGTGLLLPMPMRDFEVRSGCIAVYPKGGGPR